LCRSRSVVAQRRAMAPGAVKARRWAACSSRLWPDGLLRSDWPSPVLLEELAAGELLVVGEDGSPDQATCAPSRARVRRGAESGLGFRLRPNYRLWSSMSVKRSQQFGRRTYLEFARGEMCRFLRVYGFTALAAAVQVTTHQRVGNWQRGVRCLRPCGVADRALRRCGPQKVDNADLGQ
jgi:hypothetical protein